MSRIGKQTIHIPQGVTVEVKDGFVAVKGPKGELKRVLNPLVAVNVNDGSTVTCDVVNKEEKKERALWGTFASHIKNMITGVSEGFKKQLEINGVGYKISLQGKDLKIEVGFSHPIIFEMPKGMSVAVEKNIITLESADKELLGQVAAEVRSVRKPEPYKGKGIKYLDEVVRRKAGKVAGKTAGA
ncbi:MAG: 50S ribosomal protein L6 [Patescibacteria group bacterium]